MADEPQGSESHREEPVREEMDWPIYGAAVRELAHMVADDGYQPDMILCIARGGLFVAGSLGYALAVKNLYVINVEYYTGVDERLDIPVILPPYVDWVDLGEGRKLVTEQHRLAHFLLRSRELVAQEVGECSFARLETIKNPFLSPAQCRHCVKSDELAMLSARDRETIESRRAQLTDALAGLRMRGGKSVEETVAEIVCRRLEKRTKRPRT